MSMEISVILMFVAGFFISRAVGGIIGEYAKRLWFGSVEPWISERAMRLKNCVVRRAASKRRLENQVALLQLEHAVMKSQLEKLLDSKSSPKLLTHLDRPQESDLVR